ncbi:MAG: hypothetical protein ISS68_13515 [Desulfobacteraceae bacterium]|nr:hypothetical protein [Desulfobacteraceae bacterium]
MILSFHPCFDTDVQIILGDKSLDTDNLECIRKSDAIILPQACTQDLYEICATSNAHVFPNYEARIKYPGKIGQSLLFEGLDLPPSRDTSLAVHSGP